MNKSGGLQPLIIASCVESTQATQMWQTNLMLMPAFTRNTEVQGISFVGYTG